MSLVKRIVAMDGDTIFLQYDFDDGQIVASLVSKYTLQIHDENWSKRAVEIPDGYMWVESDARSGAGSTEIGLVHVQDILGIMPPSVPPEEFWYANAIYSRRERHFMEQKRD